MLKLPTSIRRWPDLPWVLSHRLRCRRHRRIAMQSQVSQASGLGFSRVAFRIIDQARLPVGPRISILVYIAYHQKTLRKRWPAPICSERGPTKVLGNVGQQPELVGTCCQVIQLARGEMVPGMQRYSDALRRRPLPQYGAFARAQEGEAECIGRLKRPVRRPSYTGAARRTHHVTAKPCCRT